MAKSKSKRRQKKTEPKQAPAFAHWRLVGAACLIALAAASGWWWQGQSEQESAFEDQARRGRPALDQVVVHANEGQGHLGLGETVQYQSDPPTSGIHNLKWIDPWVYTRLQPREKLVHSLEHGMVVIYYDKPTVPAAEALDHWADLFGAPWSGVVVAPRPGLGETLILAAWRRTLTLNPFDGDAGAAFIDAYRGRGPEHPVR